MTEPDGLAYWESLEHLPAARAAGADPRRPAVVAGQASGRRSSGGPGRSTGSTARPSISSPTRQARRAVTSHDVLQNLQVQAPQMRERLGRVVRAGRPDPVGLAVQHRAAAGGLPRPAGAGWRYVPNGAEDLFFEPPTGARTGLRSAATLGCRPGCPTCSRWPTSSRGRTWPRLVRAAARLPEVARGELALVLLGTGAEARGPARCARRPRRPAAAP